jgi:Helix-turn-helix domain
MSFTAQHWALQQRCNGGGIAKSILLYLAMRADANGLCHPGVERICQDLQFGEMAVRKGIRSLADQGLIQRQRRDTREARAQAEIKRGRSTLYMLPVGKPVELPWSNPHEFEGVAVVPDPHEFEGVAAATKEPTPTNQGGSTPTNSRGESSIESPVQESLLVGTSPSCRRPRAKTRTSDERATRIPDDWTPSESDRAYAIAHGVDPDRAGEEFRLYWSSATGRSARKLDWSQGFKQRVLENQDRGRFRLNAPANDQGRGRPFVAPTRQQQRTDYLAERIRALSPGLVDAELVP